MKNHSQQEQREIQSMTSEARAFPESRHISIQIPADIIFTISDQRKHKQLISFIHKEVFFSTCAVSNEGQAEAGDGLFKSPLLIPNDLRPLYSSEKGLNSK